jgi:hypothetical protein
MFILKQNNKQHDHVHDGSHQPGNKMFFSLKSKFHLNYPTKAIHSRDLNAKLPLAAYQRVMGS